MQGGRGGRGPFSDPFAAFGGFGSFGPPRSLLSDFFGGRDPFDDPFFTRPFGGMFESGVFGPAANPFPQMHPTGFLEQQAPEPRKSRGPIIEELNSDDEDDSKDEKKENPRKHSRSSGEPYIEDPDDEVEEKRSRSLQCRNEYNGFNETVSQPQGGSFCFHSSTVSYGGPSGSYYTSSRTRRSGSDGLTFEEFKEADSSTRQASHRVSRGLHNKGHSLARKLNSDGKVDSMQTLHNLHEDELAGFEQAWKGNAQKHLPGWSGTVGTSSSAQAEQARQGVWALPSTERPHPMRTRPEIKDKVGSSGTNKWPNSAHHLRGKGQN